MRSHTTSSSFTGRCRRLAPLLVAWMFYILSCSSPAEAGCTINNSSAEMSLFKVMGNTEENSIRMCKSACKKESDTCAFYHRLRSRDTNVEQADCALFSGMADGEGTTPNACSSCDEETGTCGKRVKWDRLKRIRVLEMVDSAACNAACDDHAACVLYFYKGFQSKCHLFKLHQKSLGTHVCLCN